MDILKYQGIGIEAGVILHKASGQRIRLYRTGTGIFLGWGDEWLKCYVEDIGERAYISKKFLEKGNVYIRVSGYGFTRLEIVEARNQVRNFKAILSGGADKFQKAALGIGKSSNLDIISQMIQDTYGDDMLMEAIWD